MFRYMKKQSKAEAIEKELLSKGTIQSFVE